MLRIARSFGPGRWKAGFPHPSPKSLQRCALLRPVFANFQGCITVYLSRCAAYLVCKRRRRDLNPRAAINDLHPFQGCPFSHLGYFSTCADSTARHRADQYDIAGMPCRFVSSHDIFRIQTPLCSAKGSVWIQRRGWDSNPRALSDKRFSRPPRYDRFDTSPGHINVSLRRSDRISAKVILSKTTISVNFFFAKFSPIFNGLIFKENAALPPPETIPPASGPPGS